MRLFIGLFYFVTALFAGTTFSTMDREVLTERTRVEIPMTTVQPITPNGQDLDHDVYEGASLGLFTPSVNGTTLANSIQTNALGQVFARDSEGILRVLDQDAEGNVYMRNSNGISRALSTQVNSQILNELRNLYTARNLTEEPKARAFINRYFQNQPSQQVNPILAGTGISPLHNNTRGQVNRENAAPRVPNTIQPALDGFDSFEDYEKKMVQECKDRKTAAVLLTFSDGSSLSRETAQLLSTRFNSQNMASYRVDSVRNKDILDAYIDARLIANPPVLPVTLVLAPNSNGFCDVVKSKSVKGKLDETALRASLASLLQPPPQLPVLPPVPQPPPVLPPAQPLVQPPVVIQPDSNVGGVPVFNSKSKVQQLLSQNKQAGLTTIVLTSFIGCGHCPPAKQNLAREAAANRNPNTRFIIVEFIPNTPAGNELMGFIRSEWNISSYPGRVTVSP